MKLPNILRISLLFLPVYLLLSCGSHKNTPTLVGISIDSTLTNDGWATEEATFEEWEDQTEQAKGDMFVNQSDNIKTILLYAGDNEMNAPFLSLNSDEQLTLRFDFLGDTDMNLSYQLVHCNAKWIPSDIFETDFIAGINTTNIYDISNAVNTTTNYIHYQTNIPDEKNDILLSGNYLVRVFHTDYPDSLVFQAPFYVVDQKVSVKANMVAPRINDAKAYMQNIEFTIQHPSYEINNPYTDIYVVATQNQQQYLVREGLSPVVAQNNEIVYKYDEPTYFEGGNEFRYIDIKSINYQTPEVSSIDFDGTMQHAYLQPNEKRTFKLYTSQADINGRFLIQNDEGQAPHIDGDYLMTHFKLKFDHDFPNAEIFVAGGLSNNQLLPSHKMTFNMDKKMYEADILLKQGYYNYQYVTKYKKEGNISLSYVEGSHDDTENDYSILVYFKNQALNTHELIGYQRFNSVK